MELEISQQITWNPKFHLIYNLKLHAKLYVVTLLIKVSRFLIIEASKSKTRLKTPLY